MSVGIGTKIFGAGCASLLAILGIKELTHFLYHEHEPESPAYVIEVTESGPVVVEEAGPPDFGLLLANASVDAGKRVAAKCTSCHAFESGGANAIGPGLYGVIGNAVATHGGFAYSAAMREYGADGKVWLYQNMYDYLENPRKYVPGTAMSFAGLRKQDERINIIAYMRSLDDTPEPLPEPLPVAGVVETNAAETAGLIEGDLSEVADPVADSVDGIVEEAGDLINQTIETGGLGAAEEPQPAQ
jgi:cytochrome c